MITDWIELGSGLYGYPVTDGIQLRIADRDTDFKRESCRASLRWVSGEVMLGIYDDLATAKLAAPKDAARLLRVWAARLDS